MKNKTMETHPSAVLFGKCIIHLFSLPFPTALLISIKNVYYSTQQD
jgi:hypothetical protein